MALFLVFGMGGRGGVVQCEFGWAESVIEGESW